MLFGLVYKNGRQSAVIAAIRTPALLDLWAAESFSSGPSERQCENSALPGRPESLQAWERTGPDPVPARGEIQGDCYIRYHAEGCRNEISCHRGMQTS